MSTIELGTNAVALSAGLLIARLTFGLLMAAHGSQKLFGWFGGHGLSGTGGFFDALGFRPGKLFAGIAAGTELISGVLIALGLFGPVGPALMVSVMVVATLSVHLPNGMFATSNGIEVPLLYGAVAVVLALTGPGALSLDAALGIESLWSVGLSLVVLVIGILGGLGNVLARRPVAA